MPKERPWWLQIRGVPPPTAAAHLPSAGNDPDPRSLRAGCSDAVGEVILYLALGAVVLINMGLVHLLSSLTQRSPLAGIAAVVPIAVGWLYGLRWTIRARPGLYLESLFGSSAVAGRSDVLGRGRVRPLRVTAMIFFQFTTAGLLGYWVFWLLGFR